MLVIVFVYFRASRCAGTTVLQARREAIHGVLVFVFVMVVTLVAS